jgi:hypothetical protein
MNKTPQAPDPIVFFIDRCLGKHPIIEQLRATGAVVKGHDDHFPQNAQDVEWIPEVGRREWVILTKDARIARNPLERRAVAYARIRMFTLVAKKLSGAETAIAFQLAMPAMIQLIHRHPPPFIAKVYPTGRVSVWKKSAELLREIGI